MEHFFRKETFCVYLAPDLCYHDFRVASLNSCRLLRPIQTFGVRTQNHYGSQEYLHPKQFHLSILIKIPRARNRIPSNDYRDNKMIFSSAIINYFIILWFLSALMRSDGWEYTNTTWDSDNRVTDFTLNYHVNINIIINWKVFMKFGKE